MDNYKLNHELNQYDHIEGIEFDGLMPKFMEKIGMTTGTSDKSVKMFEFHPAGGNSLEVIDTYEIMNNGEDGGEGGGDSQDSGSTSGNTSGSTSGDTSGSTSGDTSGSTSGDTSGETGSTQVETEADFDFIYNSGTYDAALRNAPLQAYYQDYPNEDLWNNATDSQPGFNDKVFTVKMWTNAECEGDYEVKQFKSQWYSDNGVQKIIDVNDSSIEYYLPTFFENDGPDVAHELFAGAEGGYVATPDDLIYPCSRWIKVESVSYGGDNVVHSWKAVNKDAFPWVVVELPKPFDGTIKFTYDETNVVEREQSTDGGYYIAQVANLFGSEYKIDENDQTTFDEEKLVVTLITEE